MYQSTRTAHTMMTREFTTAGHTDRVTITRSNEGWDVREERDDQVVRTARYTDWHRVERAMWIFEVRNAASKPESRPGL
jgi:hypothetical protein